MHKSVYIHIIYMYTYVDIPIKIKIPSVLVPCSSKENWYDIFFFTLRKARRQN